MIKESAACYVLQRTSVLFNEIGMWRRAMIIQLQVSIMHWDNIADTESVRQRGS